eukprot:TRINITY_DN2531_c0_g1_i2.p1 TRINITY_DN2531_c0_g1~~TRINITY_DN2531_c0_g1_i2.p1  ORF type:complete len:457 (-),score=107.53 TRINITY_DN2531_c0_g1_i2:16-1386(-)
MSYQRQREIMLGLLLGGLIIVGLVSYFWQNIQAFLGHQTATVTQLTLEDKELKIKVEDFAKALINELLDHYTNDKQTQQVTVDFVSKIFADPATTKAAVNLVNNVLQDESFKAQTVNLSNYIVGVVLNDQHTTDQVVVLLKKVAAMEETQNLLQWLFVKLFNDETIQLELQKLFIHVFSQDSIVNKSNDLANTAATHVLSDPAVIATAQNFVNQTLNDGAVQEAAGYAIWEAFMVAVTPSLFRSRQHQETENKEEAQPQPSTAPEEPPKLLREGLVSVPDEYLEDAAEILFREAYERSQKATEGEPLGIRQRMFEIELSNTKKTLSSKLKNKFQEIINENFRDVFEVEKAIDDLGGENGLVIRAKSMIEKQIALYEDYLEKMRKGNKGYIYDSYTAAQLDNRKAVQQMIKELEEESLSRERCIEKAKKSLGLLDRNPIMTLKKGTLEELLNSKERE